MKAQHILDTEPSSSGIKNIVLHPGGLYIEMSFLDIIGHIITETGLKILYSVLYAENTVPICLMGSFKVIARAIRAHTLVDCSRYI